VTKTPNQIARQQEAQKILSRKERFRKAVQTPFGWVFGFIIGTMLGQPVLVRLWPAPRAIVTLQETKQESCLVYTIVFRPNGEIDDANFTIRFPNQLVAIRMGVPQNVAQSPGEDAQQAFLGDINGIGGKCEFASSVNFPLDETAVTDKAFGNTASVHIGKIPERMTAIGMALALPLTSSMTPAPKQPYFEGRFSYTKFGMSVHRDIRFFDGTTDAK
jgi:hypothetical protein